MAPCPAAIVSPSVITSPSACHPPSGGERGHERLLRDVDPADGLHPLLALFLLLEQLALTADVAAVTLREHVFADGADVLARDDLGADRSLHGDFELLTRDELLELDRHPVAMRVGGVLGARSH